MTITVSAILAMSENRVIGKNNRMPWHIPADLKHFKQTTMGKPVIMGRKSYESLGKPLPGRLNIVISRQFKTLDGFAPTALFDEMEAVGPAVKNIEKPVLTATIEDAVKIAKQAAEERGLDEIFITGGGEIYKAAMPLTERIYLTVIHREYDGDVFFPEINENEWEVTSAEEHAGDPGFTIKVLDRK